MKTIVALAVLLFGLLLISTIGASTAAATKPEWTGKSDAVVITPKSMGVDGEIRAYIHVPERAIERSPVLWALEELEEYTLTISATAGGTTDPAPESYVCYGGTVVTVTANPDSGYLFDYWELDGAVSLENPIDVLMDADHTLRAVFVLPPD